MAFIRCKGTALQVTVATVLTEIAQVISLDLPEAETETYEADSLDNENAGIPYKPTGRAEGGSVGYEMFLDPALAGHQALTDLLTTPTDIEDLALQIVFADSDATEWPMVAAGMSLGGTVALNDGLKASGNFKLDGMVTFPS